MFSWITATPRRIWFIAGLTLVVAIIFAFDLTPWVRGGFGWRWEYLPAPLLRVVPLALSLLLYVLIAWLILTRTQHARYALLWGLVGTVLLSLAVAYAREGDILYFLFTRTVSLPASSEWWMSASIDWTGSSWRDWTGVMAQLGAVTTNAATSPPGIPLLYGLTTDLVGDALYPGLLPLQCHNYDLLTFTPAEWGSAWLGMLTPLWAGFAVFPLYSLTRRLVPAADARIAALWWALVPGILLFTTSSSTFFPVLALLILDLLSRGLTRWSARQPVSPSDQAQDMARHIPTLSPQPSYLSPFPFFLSTAFSSALAPQPSALIVLAGLVYGIGLTLNFIFLPLAALYGFYTLLHYALIDRPQGIAWTRPFIVGFWFGLGAIIPWAIIFAITQQTPLDMLQVSLGTHLELERPYAYWVWMHLWDWAIFTGFALVLLWLASFIDLFRQQRNSPVLSGDTQNSSQPPPRQRRGLGRGFLSLSLLLTLLALTLSGTTRGESGRIWLVLSPFALIVASGMVLTRASWLPLTITQALFTLILGAVLAVHNAPDLTPPPTSPVVSVTRPTDATFTTSTGTGYRLAGWDAEIEDNAIILRLQWQGMERPLQYQWFSAVLVAPDGATYPVEPWQPGGLDDAPRFPTTCWGTKMLIGDTVRLLLPENALPGDWYISLAAFGDDALPDGRLIVTLPGGSTDTQVGLGPVTLP